jgi:hypothetical protein
MPTIHFVDGEKGGVGKSFVARAMIQYALDRHLSFIAVEADRMNPDVANVYQDVCKRAVFTENEKEIGRADRIFELATRKSVIVSLPSQVHLSMKTWFERNQLFDLKDQFGVSFIKWFVCNGEFDSINLLLNSLNYYGEKIPHILVRNWGLCDEWEQVDEDDTVIESIKKYKVKVIDFPKLGHNERYLINKKQLTFDAARLDSDLTILGKQRVVNFLNSAYSAFDSTQAWSQSDVKGELCESAKR